MKLTLTTTAAQKQLTMADLRPGDFAEIVDESAESKWNIIHCIDIGGDVGCFSLNAARFWSGSHNVTLKVRKLTPGETLTITE